MCWILFKESIERFFWNLKVEKKGSLDRIMKKNRLIKGSLVLSCCLIFSACGSEIQMTENAEQSLQEDKTEAEPEVEKTAEGQKPQENQELQQEQVTEEIENAEPVVLYGDYRDISDEVYRDLIKEMMDVGAFPKTNGSECAGAFYENHYAVTDIDGDGREELLIDFSNADYMAGMVLYIYDYDQETKEAYIEFSGFPSIEIYDNGYLKEDLSHNHGRSVLEDFWPYFLSKYNAEEDQYERIACMDAWQKQIYEDEDPDPEFPDEKDLDGDGIVYYDYSDDYSEPEMVMDRAEYEQWCEQYQSGNIQEINWKQIISEETYDEMYPMQPAG